tara:strand:- start:1606 stop:2022 length:417 start_codon:yes stop_codon:yes gene_type:complete
MSTLNVANIKSLTASAPVFQNSSGVEKGQLVKAWVNFNGGGSLTSSNQSGVNDSFNVTSVIDSGTGLYTININNNMSNTNYVVAAIVEVSGNDNNTSETVNMRDPASRSTGSFQLRTGNTENNALKDLDRVNAVVFGD